MESDNDIILGLMNLIDELNEEIKELKEDKERIRTFARNSLYTQLEDSQE